VVLHQLLHQPMLLVEPILEVQLPLKVLPEVLVQMKVRQWEELVLEFRYFLDLVLMGWMVELVVLFGAGFPDFEQVQQQLTRNPNIMREIMNMPVVQNLMNNPDIMRNLIMSNPQMREIIDQNPELAHVLNDPSTLRQTLEAARNPELMREMMRNTDRAMSNIESSPEGFNMLRRMYENVQEPFLNATTMAGNTGNENVNPFAALLGTQGGDQAINPSSASPTTGSETAAGSPAPNTNPLPNPWTATASKIHSLFFLLHDTLVLK
jgi:ubiquilin